MLDKPLNIRAMHNQMPFQVGFTPKEMDFILKGDREVNFIYSGDLPDMTIFSAKKSGNKIIVDVKNVGKAKSGRFKVEV